MNVSRTNLVIGASGQVGGHLVSALKDKGFQVTGTQHNAQYVQYHSLDVRDKTAVDKLVNQLQPGVIYVPASLTNVEYCENNPEDSFEINVLGVTNVVAAASKVQARVVYFSSDYVFDGIAGPYDETTPVRPVNVYGMHKVYAELYIATNCSDFLILRTTVVYGPEEQRKNFIYRLLATLGNGQRIRVPIDQVGSPTYGPELARVSVELGESAHTGVYHLVGQGRTSRFEFAKEAARVFDLDETLIDPVSTSELNQSAKRPLNAGMITAKLEKITGKQMMGYQAGLEHFKQSIDEESTA